MVFASMTAFKNVFITQKARPTGLLKVFPPVGRGKAEKTLIGAILLASLDPSSSDHVHSQFWFLALKMASVTIITTVSFQE